jgi:ketosteroid isomerase-like protein
MHAELDDVVDRVVGAFGSHDVETYFSCFAEDASFLFYSSPELLPSRAAFRREWERMEAEDGYHVLECEASERRLQTVDEDTAVVTHTLRTRFRTNDGVDELRERETLVLRRDERNGWLIVHEHLSPCA